MKFTGGPLDGQTLDVPNSAARIIQPVAHDGTVLNAWLQGWTENGAPVIRVTHTDTERPPPDAIIDLPIVEAEYDRHGVFVSMTGKCTNADCPRCPIDIPWIVRGADFPG